MQLMRLVFEVCTYAQTNWRVCTTMRGTSDIFGRVLRTGKRDRSEWIGGQSLCD